jgi:hypothetical protein
MSKLTLIVTDYLKVTMNCEIIKSNYEIVIRLTVLQKSIVFRCYYCFSWILGHSCILEYAVCLLYILHRVPNVLLGNPGNNEIVGGDQRTGVRETTVFCTETEKDKLIKSITLTSKRQ